MPWRNWPASLSPLGVVYADEDSVTAAGAHVDPRLKPSYSPEFLLSSSYVGRPLAIGSGIALQVGPSGASLPDLEHDLALRACEAARQVVHLPEVLCHRRAGAPQAQRHGEADVAHVADALRRRGEVAEVTPGPRPRHLPGPTPSAGIGDHHHRHPVSRRAALRRAPASSRSMRRGARRRSTSCWSTTARCNRRRRPWWSGWPGGTTSRWWRTRRPFNWSALNNAAVALARGDVLLFLNNDIEARQPGWLDVLTAQAMRPDVGAVGARLLYPGRPAPTLRSGDRRRRRGRSSAGRARRESAGLSQHGDAAPRECAAVTGACLATRREVFDSLGGFDESLGVDLNDIDYCLRAQREGLKVLYEARAELIHHESPSRGFAGGARDIRRFIDRWRTSILAGDPYLSPTPHPDRLVVRAARCGRRRMVASMVREHLRMSDPLPPTGSSGDPTPRHVPNGRRMCTIRCHPFVRRTSRQAPS